MNEPPDPLEVELSALRPRELSPQLRRRVAERLADSSVESRRRLWWFAVAGGLAAACIVMVFLTRDGGKRIQPIGNEFPRPTATTEPTEPTLLAYQQALARSPEELDALLQKEAIVPQPPSRDNVPIGTLTRSESALRALLGDD